jgi:propanol-preferring alcohol dehydrogenase
MIPGHQAVGIVDLIGDGVSRFSLGDRAGVMWMHKTCGVCGHCRSGAENLCDKAEFTGYDAMGGYAEYVIADEKFAAGIPEGFDDVHAAPLLCAGVVGYRAFRLSGARPGGRLGLWGFGASAHITLQVARSFDCKTFVFTRSNKHRGLAKSLGADWVGSPNERPPVLTDASIVFAPAGEIALKALENTAKGGTVALAGIYMSPIPSFDYNMIYGERILRSVANATARDAEELLVLAAQIPIKPEVETFPLAMANKALRALKESAHRGAGVLVI